MKIIALQGASIAVGQYRVGYPMLALHRRGHNVEVRNTSMRMRVCNAMLAGADILLLQTACDPGWINLVDTIPEQYRPKVVYELDDLVTAVPPWNPSHEIYRRSRRGMEQTIRLSDAVICSTDQLASEVFSTNPRTYVCPNHIDFGVRNWENPERRITDRLTIGWAGSAHHFGDEKPIRNVIRRVLEVRPNVDFAICSHPDLTRYWVQSLNIPDDKLHVIPGRDFEEYPGVLSHFDIGIAPLEDTRFNRCKSDLKLLEYGAWGIPYVASDIEPYRKFHVDSGAIGGDICRSEEEWIKCLLYQIDHPGFREDNGKKIKEYVRSKKGLDNAGMVWESALMKILALPPNAYRKRNGLPNTPQATRI